MGERIKSHQTHPYDIVVYTLLQTMQEDDTARKTAKISKSSSLRQLLPC